MVVVVEAVLAVIADIDVWPAIVVVVGARAAISPAIISDAGRPGHIRKRSVVVVVEQRCVRRFFLSIQRIERRAVHQVDVQPTIVVVVEKANTGTIRFHDELLLGYTHLVDPVAESGLLGDVLEDNRPFVDESTGGNWAPLFIVDRRRRDTSGDASHSTLLLRRGGRRRLLRSAIAGKGNDSDQ